MFFKLFRTRLKCLCKNRSNLFWSFAFPIMLAIFFFMGFHNLTSGEQLDSIPIALVEADKASEDFLLSVKTIEVSDHRQLFHIKYCDLNAAKELLSMGKIKGYIICSHKPELYIKENGMEQSLIKSFLDTYEQRKQTVTNISALIPDKAESGFNNEFEAYRNYVAAVKKEEKYPDYSLIYFYSLLALTCMLGVNWGFDELRNIQADQSVLGARISVAPVKKKKLVLANLSAAFTIHFISVILLLAFLICILKVNFGGDLWRILLVCLLGSLCGITLGAMVCVTVQVNVRLREAILNVIVVGGSFLSGMMLVDMKHLIAVKAPILGYINPVNLITDAFYCLYYYDGYGKFFFNVVLLSILTIVFAVITITRIRRKVYASI